jgi:hypothetical protein
MFYEMGVKTLRDLVSTTANQTPPSGLWEMLGTMEADYFPQSCSHYLGQVSASLTLIMVIVPNLSLCF